ncbi:CELF4 [Symbiodinium natans]|uniref:CELF4 protein n=1 Tax=Symbiodinium natans TaxID=878477 RepID=A0A812KHC3_9DINO|nr:CELF4 [Symbiodinium natans]
MSKPYSTFQGAYARQSQSAGMSPRMADPESSFSFGKRKRLNVVSILLNVLAPWLVFCGVFAAMSFKTHHSSPVLAWLAVVAGLVLAGGAGILARRTKMQDQDPTWYTFAALALGVATISAAVLGDMNYWYNMQPYYDIENINTYPSVNPAREKGQQLMDAGRVYFEDGTGLDTSKAMAFRNLDRYCVAPIVFGQEPLASYDFWAVGVNCCSGTTADFRCGEFDNPKARSGLRLMREDQRPFFRLAVQQAEADLCRGFLSFLSIRVGLRGFCGPDEAAYNIKSNHPLFFYWMQDPVAEVLKYRSDGFKYALIAISTFFAFNILCVVGSVFAFSKLSHEF